MHLLGIDCGNTVTKVALVTERGEEIAVASRRADTLRASPGIAERDMNALWQSVAAAVRDVLASAHVAPSDIAAIGCTGHGNGLYALDRDGQPLDHALQSLDTRAADLVAEWQRSGISAAAYPTIRQSHYAASTAVLLAWFKRHQPQVYAQIGTVLLAKDFVNYCLTGALGSDYTDMSTTSLLNIPAKGYDTDLLALYGLDDIEPALPRLHASTSVIGQVNEAAAAATGLAVGTPVIAGMIDIDASAIGAGVVRPGAVSVVVGSWSINQAVAAELPANADLFLQSIFADPRYWLLCEASATSASNLEWFIAQFCGEEQRQADAAGVSVYEVCGQAVDAIAPADSDVIYHPFLYGANVHAHARAGFYNLTGWHTRTHLLRALYEGIVYGHRHHIDRLKVAGVAVEIVRLAGGAARSAVWSQMFADVLEVPVEVTASSETGALGVALGAGVGVGLYGDLVSAAENAVQVTRTYMPNSEHRAIYRARYAAFTRLIGAMRQNWDALGQPTHEQMEARS